MVAGERLFDNNGYEVPLFPMEYMNISQGEGGSYSHNSAMDFLGWNAQGRVYQCPYYAPCTCKCVAHFGTGNSTWESVNPVHLPDGTITKITFCFDHDEGTLFPIGTVKTQGDLIGHSGTAGMVTGDHMHFNTAIGTYDGYVLIPGTQWYELKNSSHIYNTIFVNNTVLYNDYGYNWQIYQGGSPTPPTPTTEHRFPWVLYARKLREMRK